MDIRQSVFGEIAIRSGGQVTGADIGALIRRLLLFETVIVRSVRLRELPFLVRAFGKHGFIELLNSGLLKIVCEWTVISTNLEVDGFRALPPCNFSFGIVDIANREDVLRQELRSLQSVSGLKNTERTLIEDYVVSHLLRPQQEYGNQLKAQVESDVRRVSPVLRAAIGKELQARSETPVECFTLDVEETRSCVFHILTDLQKMLGLSSQSEHDILQMAVGAVANLNHRIADMEAYSAITGFAESEAPLLFGKLAGVISPQNPRSVEGQFARVITIADLPEFNLGRGIDVGRILKARESAECREFRAWLAGLAQATDQQIAEMVSGFKNRVAVGLGSGIGKALRFATTTGLGLIPGLGLIAGPVAGALDAFLLERAFPTSGVLAFLTDTYPSLFNSP